MNKQNDIIKKLLKAGDHPLCKDENWFKFPKALCELLETGQINISEFNNYIFLLYKANPRSADLITNYVEISSFLGCGHTYARKVMQSIKDKGFVYFESEQGKHKFKVYVNYYPLMKEHENQSQKFSHFSVIKKNITVPIPEKCDVESISAKNPLSELRREFMDTLLDSAKSIDIDQT